MADHFSKSWSKSWQAPAHRKSRANCPGIHHWYKSNARNVAMLRQYAVDPRASTAGQWAFFIGLLAAVGLVALAFVWLIWSLIGALLG